MKTISLKFIIFSSLLFSSCLHPSLYFPDTVVSTNFDKKNTLLLNVNAKPQFNSTDSFVKQGNAFSFSTHAGYSFANHFGAYIYYSQLSNRAVQEVYKPHFIGIESLTGGNFYGNRLEFGGVYFNPYSKGQIFEVAFGHSRGNTDRRSSFTDSNNFQTQYYTFFIQPSWAYKNENIVVSLGAKIWQQHYYSFTSSPYVQMLFTNKNVFLTQINLLGVQPYLYFEAGNQYLKFSFQGSTPGLASSYKYDIPLSSFPLHVCAGMSIRIDKSLFGKLKSKNNENIQ